MVTTVYISGKDKKRKSRPKKSVKNQFDCTKEAKKKLLKWKLAGDFSLQLSDSDVSTIEKIKPYD